MKDKFDEKTEVITESERELKKYRDIAFVMPLVLDEFQCEQNEERDAILAEQAVKLGIIKTMRDDWCYTIMVTRIMDELGKNITSEEHVAMIDSVTQNYLNAVSFYANGKLITFLWSLKDVFEKYLHIVTDEICQSISCNLGMDCLIGVGKMEKGLSCIHKAYADATKVVSYSKEKTSGACFVSDIKQHKNSATLITEQALELIEKNYMDPDLSLVSISSQIAVSPNYLSASFKKIAGSTFIDLLSQKRIHVAKERLLHSNMKIKEVAEACGYRDQHYFSYCFKKYTGMSPNECRRKSVDL